MNFAPIAQSKYNFDRVTDATVNQDPDGNILAYGGVRSYPDQDDSGYNNLQMYVYKLAQPPKEDDIDDLEERVDTEQV